MNDGPLHPPSSKTPILTDPQRPELNRFAFAVEQVGHHVTRRGGQDDRLTTFIGEPVGGTRGDDDDPRVAEGDGMTSRK